jgi:zinc transporter, ZIP family
LSDFLTIFAVAAVAALASPAGGLIAIWRKPTTLFMSLSLGFAAGILFGTISFKMLPEAHQHSGLGWAVAGFILGLLALYAFDLAIHRGRVAGEKSDQRRSVLRFYRRHPPRGDEVTVLAGGTSAEEIIEGLSIGVGATLQPGLGLLIGIAIAVDNLAESLSIGELVRSGKGTDTSHAAKRILGWTSVIGISLFTSTLAGWFLFHWLPQSWLGVLLAVGGGGMFYLVVTDLMPEGEQRHYQQSSALAAAAGFMTSFVLAKLL